MWEETFFLGQTLGAFLKHVEQLCSCGFDATKIVDEWEGIDSQSVGDGSGRDGGTYAPSVDE